MTEEEKQKEVDIPESEEELREVPEEDNDEGTSENLEKALAEANDKYLRLYAEFENYKKFATKNKEDTLNIIRIGNLLQTAVQLLQTVCWLRKWEPPLDKSPSWRVTFRQRSANWQNNVVNS